MVTTIQECEITLAVALTVNADYPAGIQYGFTVDFSNSQNSRFGHDLSVLVWQSAESTPTEAQVLGHYNAYLAAQTTQQQEQSQATSARDQLKALMAGLHNLSIQDKGYALSARVFAKTNGANQATIDGIIDRASAVAYITGLAEWQAMTTASRAFLAKKLEADAGLYMLLFVVLT